ncbi:glycoside hydrolase family 3 N-terminal domain-containing protein [Sphingomonas aerolata]|uniref:glycoside hydrolase family 3 N-terminal domain-containing protein n=1 Tax=Sphingomonas aerolata TaxID=185951 RepID=UPI002FDF18B7
MLPFLLMAADVQAPDLQATPPAVETAIAAMTLEEKAAQLGSSAPALPRLDLPAYDYWSEGLHGLARNGIATVFPQAIGLAASWDTALLDQVGTVVSTEARAKYNAVRSTRDRQRFAGLHIWSPNLNIFRDPRWGRGRRPMARIPI